MRGKLYGECPGSPLSTPMLHRLQFLEIRLGWGPFQIGVETDRSSEIAPGTLNNHLPSPLMTIILSLREFQSKPMVSAVMVTS